MFSLPMSKQFKSEFQAKAIEFPVTIGDKCTNTKKPCGKAVATFEVWVQGLNAQCTYIDAFHLYVMPHQGQPTHGQ